jgi:hypothetical protein
MPSILREVIEHKLGIDSSYKPINHKERRYTPKMHETFWQEVNKLLEVEFIRPVDYTSWLANPVLVEKPDGSWRMCIDYTSLNKACPKDEYPLSRICQIIDSTTSCELLSFLDAYLGYHQNSLAIDNEEKTMFNILGSLWAPQRRRREPLWFVELQKQILCLLCMLASISLLFLLKFILA